LNAEARRGGGRGRVPRVAVLPHFRDPKPLHGEEYNGQGEHKSVVLWRGRSRLFGPRLAVDYRQELC